MVAGWVLLGTSLWATLRAMGLGGNLLAQLPRDTAAVAMAIVGGFVSMIPGGLFAREAVLTELLGPQVGGAELALLAAAVLRLVWLVAEAGISVILYPVGRRHRASNKLVG